MTLEELNSLREIYSFPPGVRVRLPEERETIVSARPGELVPNAWRSIACSMALWRVFKYTLSLFEFRNLFSDEWEFSEDATREGAPRISAVIIRLGSTATSQKFSKRFLSQWRSQGAFSVPMLLGSRSFRQVFVSLGSMASGTAGEELPRGGASSSSGDAGESRPSNEHVRQQSPSRDDSGGKVLDPILDRSMNAPSSGSNPTSKSCSGSSLSAELESDVISKRISFKKLGEKLEKSKNGSSSRTPAPAKGVVIGEKHAKESLASSPSKKSKVDDSSKGKGVNRELEGKKKVISSSNAPTTPATASSRPGEGTSANLGTVLGPMASILGSPSVVKKLLRGVILSTDKEKVDKLTLDQTATKLFHRWCSAPLLAVRSKEAGEHASPQEGRIASMESEVAHLQKLSADLEQQLAEARLRRHHSDLAIDLEGTALDQDLLAEQDEAAEEKEKLDENEGVIKTVFFDNGDNGNQEAFWIMAIPTMVIKMPLKDRRS
ncbi:hypothetical protein Acr_26g0001030 [Actinidia rufa]|uniref:Uncharacterized protein n=1 Tax=Actinidia rufa TaxID=165716 RepID=A0A7J0H169_9ERIC|nr:hypothetical protein Acr_26g0001030 [Actinidia rufa]